MSIECALCERDMRGPHAPDCPRRFNTTALGPDEFIGPCLINGIRYVKPLIRVARVTLDGSTCVVPLSELLAMLGDGQTYEVQVTNMRKAEFERLEEFEGF